MLRSRLHSHVQLLASSQLLGVLRGSSSCIGVTGAAPAADAATAAAAAHGGPHGARLQQQQRWYAADAEPQELSTELSRAAHELGLDAVPFEQLKVMMDPLRNRASPTDEYEVSGAPPKQRRLTYGDVQGFRQVMEAIVTSNDTYQMHSPEAPVLESSHWLEAHFKEAGWTKEPRGPFYVWRAWAAAHLPREQYETLTCVHEAMAEEGTRSAFVKQAQHELARLWDWQQRRAALGLSPDLPPTPAAAAAAASAAGSNDMPAASILQAGAQVTAADSAAATVAAQDAADAQAAAQGAELEMAAAAAEAEAAAAAAGVEDELLPFAAGPPDTERDVLDVLEQADALEAQAAAAAAAAEAKRFWDVPNVVDTQPSKDASAAGRRGSSLQVGRAVEEVTRMLRDGEYTKNKGKFVRDAGVTLRVYKPVTGDGDIFLPTKPLGNKEVAAMLSDPNRTTPVNPDKVRKQAEWLVEAAQRSAHTAGAAAGAARGSTSTGEGLATWTSMPLLDRTVLHEETLKEAAERLAAKPKAELPWQVIDDGYTFSIQQRPPTKTLDLLTSYLEVRYADVLLQKDAVQSMQRQLALETFQSSSGLGSELLEQPPAALTAAKTLSPEEREGVSKTLDDLLESKQYGRYRDAVLQLYCDGLVSWEDLQECWAAAQAGEELTAGAQAPVSIAGDRQQLFQILSGQQQLPSKALSLDSSSSSSDDAAAAAAAAAARKAWEEASSKMQASGSAADSSAEWLAGGGVSYEEAEQTWQQLLHLAGQPEGPRFDQVLAAGSSSSDGLQQQLQKLQAALQRSLGLDQQLVQDLAGVGSSSSSSGGLQPAELQQLLQDVFVAPPTLEQVLQQRLAEVSQQELGSELDTKQPVWPQMWRLLQRLAAQQQQQQEPPAPATVDDAAQQFDKYLRETEGVPLTPPPYPGARRLLRWEQRLKLHASSGQVVMPEELKVKMSVSAAELQQETGLSQQGLQYLLAVAGDRYDASSGDLTISSDRFPTREENRRWCLEVLHKLLQTAQGRHPSKSFWVDSSILGVPPGNPVPAATA